MDVVNKVAVVTGGGSGIGAATCHRLAREGVKAIGVVDMQDSIVSICQRENEALGRDILVPFQGDVVDAAFRERVFDELEERFGKVALCVPAAGITLDRLSVKVEQTNGTPRPRLYSEVDFRRILDVDLLAPIYWAMRAIGSVAVDRVRQGLGEWNPTEGVQGAVVLIGSVSSSGNRGQISYASAKAGLEGAQATLSMEAVFYGVRCAIIHPGFTDTPMVRALGEETISKRVLPNTQLRRLIRPEEIAEAIVFLLRNSSVSGSLWADAGWHPGP
jgi:NAD(P)-dependent dehydrogenase (short-subunit alcohol dehydrogenase family)